MEDQFNLFHTIAVAGVVAFNYVAWRWWRAVAAGGAADTSFVEMARLHWPLLLLPIAALVMGVAVVVQASFEQDAKAWEAFVAEHHCIVVAKRSGDLAAAVGVTSTGHAATGITWLPGKTSWRCDDEVVYTR